MRIRVYVSIISTIPDVFVEVPDTLDISHLRSKGLQPNEELLPEETGNSQMQAYSEFFGQSVP